MPEMYISTDIETDGPIPGINSMFSFGSAAYLPDKTLVGTFSANLEILPEAKSNPKTMAWWETQPEAWSACRQNLQAPDLAKIPGDTVGPFNNLNEIIAWAGFDISSIETNYLLEYAWQL